MCQYKPNLTYAWVYYFIATSYSNVLLFFMKTISMRIITNYFLLIIILESGKLRAIVGVAVSGKKECVLFIMNSYLNISLSIYQCPYGPDSFRYVLYPTASNLAALLRTSSSWSSMYWSILASYSNYVKCMHSKHWDYWIKMNKDTL